MAIRLRQLLRPALMALFFVSGSWLLLNTKDELVSVLQSAYKLGYLSAVYLALAVGIVQFSLSFFWAQSRYVPVARVATTLFLIVGIAHITFLLIANVKIGCGCGARPDAWSPRTFNVISLGKNVIILGAVALALPYAQFAQNRPTKLALH